MSQLPTTTHPGIDFGWIAPAKPDPQPFGLMYFFPFDDASYGGCASDLDDEPCVVDVYQPSGGKSIKFESVDWGDVEPSAPDENGHHYQWGVLDDWVAKWTAAGMEPQLHITPASSWGGCKSGVSNEDDSADGEACREEGRARLRGLGLDSEAIIELGAKLPREPHADQWDNYRAFISAMANRYKGKIREYELMNEAQSLAFFNGNAEQYNELLRVTADEIHAVDATARVIHYGIALNGFAYGNPSFDELRFRIDEHLGLLEQSEGVNFLDEHISGSDLRKIFGHSYDFMFGDGGNDQHNDSGTLSQITLYDAIDLHANMEIEDMAYALRFLRKQLKAYVADHRAETGQLRPVPKIIIGDSTSAPQLAPSPLLQYHRFAPEAAERYHYLVELKDWPLTAGACGEHPGWQSAATVNEVVAWYKREQATFLVKKNLVALALGASKVMTGVLEDWSSIGGCNFMEQGLVESAWHNIIINERVYGDPKAGFFALQQMSGLLDGVTRVKTLSFYDEGGEDVPEVGAVVLRFTVGNDKVVYVGWHNQGTVRLPGLLGEQATSEQSSAYELELGVETACVSSVVTEIDTNGHPVIDKSEHSVVNGKLTLTLGDRPVFVEEGPCN